MLINQEFINHLTPVEVTFFKIGIDNLYKEKVKPDTTNYENVSSHVTCCPHCGSVHFVKNGFNPHHKQKYRCKDCRSVFMAATGTNSAVILFSSMRLQLHAGEACHL